MRKIVSLTVFCPLLLAIAACGQSAPDEAPAEAPAGAEPVPADAAMPAGDAAPATAGTTAATAGATPSTAASVAAAEPPAAFAQCRACHSVEPGQNGVGPSLHGVFGEKAASVEGFNFSDALKNSGLTLDRATLDKWLQGPTELVPGTRMVTRVSDPAQRKAIIDYLEALK